MVLSECSRFFELFLPQHVHINDFILEDFHQCNNRKCDIYLLYINAQVMSKLKNVNPVQVFRNENTKHKSEINNRNMT